MDAPMLYIDCSQLADKPGSVVEHEAYETYIEAWHQKALAIAAMVQGRWHDAAHHCSKVVGARAKLAYIAAMRENPDKVRWMCVACSWSGEGYELYHRQKVAICPSCGRSGALTASIDSGASKPPQRPKT